MSPPTYSRVNSDDREEEELKSNTQPQTQALLPPPSSSAATNTLNNIPSASVNNSQPSVPPAPSDFFSSLSGFASRITHNIQQQSQPSSLYQPPPYHPPQPQELLPSASSSAAANEQKQDSAEMIDSLNSSNAEVQSLITTIKQRDWKRTLRPPSVFINPRCFSKPRTSTEAATRIEQNVSYYFTNYIIIVGLVTLFSILSSPSILILLLALAALWSWSLKYDTLTLVGHTVTGRTKNLALGGISLVLLFIVAGSTIFSIVGLCSVVISIHALLNDRGGLSITDENAGDEENDALANV